MRDSSIEARLPLSVHHIGARAGTRSFPVLFCESDVVNVLYEADPSSIRQIEERNARLPSRLIVYPHCIDRVSGAREFYLFSNRYYSSFLPMEPAEANTYQFDKQFAWDDDPISKSVVETLSLETVSLDELLSRADAAPPPDFLSLDTQGSELDILQGAERLLTQTCVAIKTEVSFSRMYKEQALFPEIQSYLGQLGFRLAELKVFEVTSRTSQPIPIGLRGQGFPLQGEALFMKDAGWILGHHECPDVDLVKAFFLLFVLGYFSHAYLVTRLAEFDAAFTKLVPFKERYAYLRFCGEYVRMSREYPDVPPVAYSVIVPPEQSAARFGDAFQIQPDLVRGRFFREISTERLARALVNLVSEEYVGIECLARDFDLPSHAESLRNQRLSQIRGLLRWLGLQVEAKK